MSKAKARARKQKKATGARQTRQTASMSRRNLLTYAAYGSGAVFAAGAAGAWVVKGVRATAAEQNLARLGQGVPAIVQVHDPTCPNCTALQRQVRRTLDCLGDDAPLYLVASINTEMGSAFAFQHALPHVTLAFVNAEGGLVTSLTGVRQLEELKPIFRDFAAA